MSLDLTAPSNEKESDKEWNKKSISLVNSSNDNSIRFDIHSHTIFDQIRPVVSLLVKSIDAYSRSNGLRKRTRTPAEHDRFRTAVRLFVLNLYRAYLSGQDLAISLAKGTFRSGSRYANLYLTYRPYIAAYEGLSALGLIQVTRRWSYTRVTGKGRTTRIAATPKLIEMFDTEDFEEIVIGRAPNAETIILRRDKKLVRRNKRLGINADTEPQIEYPDTPDTIRMRENLKRINAKLRDCGASLLPGENAFWKCAERMAQKGERGPLLCTQNHLHRVFNNGSFTDGGRLVGGWWQGVPREYRKFIYISDIPSIELDYASLHPTMLYHQRGLDVDGDPYAIDGLPRDVAKKLFNALVNGRSHFSQDTRRMVTDTGMSWDDAVSAVRERHPQISDSLGSGAGVRLQRIDSDIAEDVLLTMLDQGITCLPIHDSFIVQFCHEKALRDAMQAAYGRQFQGWKIGIERKPSILDGGG